MKKYLAILGILAIIFIVAGCTTGQKNESIKIGIQTTPETALIQIADEKGYFAQQNIDVNLVEFTAGKFALQAMLAGSVDFAAPGEVPVALAKMQGSEINVLSQIAECATENPVLAIDKGISDPKEYFLKEKRKLSTSNGGTPEFYTYNFLKYYGIGKDQVEIIAQKPEEMPSTLASGSVDAISVFEPYPSNAEELLPGKTIRFELPAGIYSPTYVVVANKAFVDENPETAKKVLRALIKAEEFAKQNPEEAKQIVAKRTKLSEKIIGKIWSSCSKEVKIDDKIIETWKAESQWALETGKVKENTNTDFSEIIRKDLLASAEQG